MIRILVTATAVDEQGNTTPCVVEVDVFTLEQQNGGPVKGFCDIGKFEFMPSGKFEAFSPLE